jgi:hypothetical protein
MIGVVLGSRWEEWVCKHPNWYWLKGWELAGCWDRGSHINWSGLRKGWLSKVKLQYRWMACKVVGVVAMVLEPNSGYGLEPNSNKADQSSNHSVIKIEMIVARKQENGDENSSQCVSFEEVTAHSPLMTTCEIVTVILHGLSMTLNELCAQSDSLSRMFWQGTTSSRSKCSTEAYSVWFSQWLATSVVCCLCQRSIGGWWYKKQPKQATGNQNTGKDFGWCVAAMSKLIFCDTQGSSKANTCSGEAYWQVYGQSEQAGLRQGNKRLAGCSSLNCIGIWNLQGWSRIEPNTNLIVYMKRKERNQRCKMSHIKPF